MKLAAVHALANCVKNPNEENIIPSVYDKNVVKEISNAVAKAARESGVAQK